MRRYTRTSAASTKASLVQFSGGGQSAPTYLIADKNWRVTLGVCNRASSTVGGAMKVTSVKVDPAGASGREKCLVAVCVQLSGTKESMTINVVVADEHDELAVQESGIARAKDFARQFANLNSVEPTSAT
jgi:hypothetical protein